MHEIQGCERFPGPFLRLPEAVRLKGRGRPVGQHGGRRGIRGDGPHQQDVRFGPLDHFDVLFLPGPLPGGGARFVDPPLKFRGERHRGLFADDERERGLVPAERSGREDPCAEEQQRKQEAGEGPAPAAYHHADHGRRPSRPLR